MGFQKQHLISQVLLRRFASSPEDGARVATYNLRTGSEYPGAPSAIAFVNSFVSHAPEEIEAVWGELESDAPAAFEELDSELPLSPETQLTLKRLVTLHFLRRQQTKQIYEEIYATRRQERVEEYRTGPPRISGVAAKLLGHLPDSQADWDKVAEQLAAGLDLVVEEIFHEQLLDMYRRAENDVQTKELLVLRPRDSEFLISDQAVLSVTESGLETRTQLFGPADHFLPAGPSVGLLLTTVRGDEYVSPEEVVAVNRFQIAAADRFVYYRPGSALSAFCSQLPHKPE